MLCVISYLKCILLQHQNFGKFMDANFFYYSIYDRFIQRQPCACMHACVHVCVHLLTFLAFVIAQCLSCVVHNFFKHLLLLNHWTNLDETWQGCSLGEALPKLFKRLNSKYNSGCHGNQNEKNSKIFENLLP